MPAIDMEDLEMDEKGTTESDSDAEQALECEWPNTPLDPDIFGLSICSLVRDFYLLARQKGRPVNRYARVVTSFLLLALCITIQVFLLSQVKRFVSAKAVHDVRIAYDMFESRIYGVHTEVLASSPTLERRGIGGPHGPYFNATEFYTFSQEEQAAVCRIPLSQPIFFWVVLYIWSLVCICEIRKTRDLFLSLVMNTENTDSMVHALEDEDTEPGGPFVVARLTSGMKMLIVVAVLAPRLGITTYLLWLGCRWLLATNNFGDLILNSIALEFVLSLKDVLYLAVVPRRTCLDLENTTIVPAQKKEPESLAALLGTITWGFFAGVWVTFYTGFHGFGHKFNGMQQVLPDYQWDVHDICTAWVMERYKV